MFKKVKDVIDKLGGMKTILVIIGGIIALKMVKGIWEFAAGASKAIKAAKALAAAEKVGGIMAIIKGAWESLGPIPFVGAALATAAVGAGVGYLLSQFVFTGDDIVSPAPGGSGYGKRTLFGPEGAIQLNNKDTIVAGTDLFKADDTVSSPAGSVQINQSPDNSKDIAELKGAIMALAARPVDVAIDGVKVIEATTGAQPNTQGVESAKNSYRIQ